MERKERKQWGGKEKKRKGRKMPRTVYRENHNE